MLWISWFLWFHRSLVILVPVASLFSLVAPGSLGLLVTDFIGINYFTGLTGLMVSLLVLLVLLVSLVFIGL